MSKLIFFGTEDFSLPFLKTLMEEGYQVVAIVTKPDSPRGRSSKPVKPAVKLLAEKHSIPVIQPQSMEEVIGQITDYGAQAGVLAAYGQLLPRKLLDSFPVGIINVHPSDLPKHRGPSPIEQTILDGDEDTAVSLIRLTQDMDAGPVYAQSKLDVPPRISKPELTKRLVETGVELLKVKLPFILSDTLKPKPQDESKATYTELIRKQNGKINWTMPAIQIERQIRAYRGWPGSFVDIFDVRITIKTADILDVQGNPGEHFISKHGLLTVYCSQDALEIKTLQPAGKKVMSSADFLRGYSA